MPKLPTFTAKLGGAGPISTRATPEAFGAAVGRGLEQVGAAGMQVGEFLAERAEADELRKVQLEAARLRANHARDLEQARLSGQDYKEVEDKYDAELYKLGELAETKKGVHAVRMAQEENRLRFYQSTTKARIARATERAQHDYSEYIEIAGAGITADPSTYEDFTKGLHSYVDSMPGLSPEQKQAIFNEGAGVIQSNAGARFVQLNPQFVKEQVGNPDFLPDLTPTQRAALSGRADELLWQRETRAMTLRRNAVWEREEAGKLSYSKSISRVINGSKDEVDTALAEAEHDPAMTGGQRAAIVRFAEAAAEQRTKPIRSNPQTVFDLFERITQDYGDPAKITHEEQLHGFFVDGQVSISDYNWLSKLIAEDRTPEGRSFNADAKLFLKAQLASLDRSTANATDPIGKERISNLQQAFFQDVTMLKDKGEDPRQLMDPKSPWYFAKRYDTRRRSDFAIMDTDIANMQSEAQKMREGQLADTQRQDSIRSTIPFDSSGIYEPETQEQYNSLLPGAKYRANGEIYTKGEDG